MRAMISILLFLAAASSAAVPSWLAAVDSGEWVEIPSSTLSTSGVMQSNGDLQMEAWGGAVLNSEGLYIGSTWTPGSFLVPWGGGHTDYEGNEVYAYGPLEADAPAWSRLRDRTSPAPVNVGQDGSGNPVSRHTYNTIQYMNDGTSNWMASFGVVGNWTNAEGFLNVQYFNFDQVSPNSNQPWAELEPGAFADVSGYDKAVGRVFYHNVAENSVCFYDLGDDNHTCEIFKGPFGYGGNAMSAVDQGRGLWFIWDRAFGLSAYRTNNGADNEYYRPSQTGDLPWNWDGNDDNNEATLLWDETRDRFVLWAEDDDDGTTADRRILFELVPPATSPYEGGNAWTWIRVAPSAGDTPTARLDNGTYGRFSYVKSADFEGYVLMNNAADAMYFYRTSSASSAPYWGVFGDNDMFLMKVGF